MKTNQEYTEDLQRTQNLIDRNLTRLAKTVSRIQKLREKQKYIWIKIGEPERAK